MRRITIAAALAAAMLAGPAAALDARDLYPALERGDTKAVASFVADYYDDAGISTNEGLTWELQSYDQIVNWYNDFTETIRLSELPTPAQAPAYWQNWSAVLTQGRWDWRAFFSSPEEAVLLANFNQFLLAAHEYGHALTYRFDPGYNARWDDEINCREYAADRLAATLLQELAQADPRIAALKARYRSLMAAINAEVAPEARYATVTYAALEADCRVMHVVQPTAETMTPYASAFFVRQGLLQAQTLASLAALYEAALLPHWRERQIASSGRAGAVSTGAPVDVAFGNVETTLETERRIPAFAADGSLYVLEYGFDGEDRLDARFAFGPASGPIVEIIPLQTVPGVRTTGDLIHIGSAVALGPDHVVALQNGLGFEGDEGLLFDLQRGAGGKWTLRTRDVADRGGYYDLWLAPDAGGAITVFEGPGLSPVMKRLVIDPETLAVTATLDYPENLGTAVAVGPAGDIWFYEDDRITVLGADGTERAFAGSGLQGFKDAADPLAAEFITARAGVALSGRLLVLDYDPVGKTWVVRTIALTK